VRQVKQAEINLFQAHLINGEPNGMVRPGTGLIHCTDPMAQGAAQALPSSGQSFYLKYFRKVVEGDIEGWYLVDQYGRRQ